MPFRSKIDISDTGEVNSDGRTIWHIDAPLIYEQPKTGVIVTVPKGRTTDFASVPRWPVVYWLFGEVGNGPAAIHDFLYSEAKLSRKASDGIYLDAMAETKVPLWRRQGMHKAVRMFGAGRYGKVKEPQAKIDMPLGG